jgi:hypothetical protein
VEVWAYRSVTHVYGDERLAEWLRENAYHPRSPKHGSASCLFFLDDLLYESKRFRTAARNGEIVYTEDYMVGEGQLRWNVDLVVGPPKTEVGIRSDDRGIAEAEPEGVWLAIDAKSVMTEHGKARRNRQRDINSFADIMYHHYPGSVTGGLLLINAADRFRSPLRDEGEITDHENIDRLVEETVEIFSNIERSEGEIDPNVDAVRTVVVEHSNIEDGQETRLVSGSPAPKRGDAVHYRTFLDTIIETVEKRFLSGKPPDMSTLRRADTLRNELNEQVVALAHIVHRIGNAIETNDLDQEQVENLRETIETIENIADEIEQL